MPTYEQTRAGYRNMWRSMAVQRVAEADAAARGIIANRSRYEAVEKKIGVPWFWVGITHLREANLNFGTYLGNGQSLSRVTTIVPKGRGPFSSWEAGATDALVVLKGLDKIKDWEVGRIGYEFERYNGFGYMPRGVNSPYLWAGSNHYTRGKYTSDGHYDSNHVDQQLGAMVVLARICALAPDVNARVNGTGKPTARDVAVGTGAVVATGGVGGAVAKGVEEGWGWQEYGLLVLGVVAVAVAALFVWHWWRTRQADKAEVEAESGPHQVGKGGPELFVPGSGDIAVADEGGYLDRAEKILSASKTSADERARRASDAGRAAIKGVTMRPRSDKAIEADKASRKPVERPARKPKSATGKKPKRTTEPLPPKDERGTSVHGWGKKRRASR